MSSCDYSQLTLILQFEYFRYCTADDANVGNCSIQMRNVKLQNEFCGIGVILMRRLDSGYLIGVL